MIGEKLGLLTSTRVQKGAMKSTGAAMRNAISLSISVLALSLPDEQPPTVKMENRNTQNNLRRAGNNVEII
jgi:hypothetical protein